MPACRQGPGLRLSIADDAEHSQLGVVERSAVRVDQRVAQLAAFVDGTRRLRRVVTRHATGE